MNCLDKEVLDLPVWERAFTTIDLFFHDRGLEESPVAIATRHQT